MEKRYTVDYDMGEYILIDNQTGDILDTFHTESHAQIMCDMANATPNFQIQ